MTTKQEMLAIIKAENPEGLKTGSDQDGYIELTKAETDAIFDKWAETRLAKEKAEAEAQAKRQATLAKLEALGLNENDLKTIGL